MVEAGALTLTLIFFGIIHYLEKKRNVDFGILTLSATGFGVITGVIFKENINYASVFGIIFTNIITAFVIPLLLFSIISSITNLGETVHLKKVSFRLVFFLLLNTFTAASLTLIAAVTLQIGKGFSYEAVTDSAATELPGFADTITALFPQNLISQWGEGQVVPVVIFAMIIAVAYNQFGKEKEEVKAFKTFVDAGNKVLAQAIGWIMRFTPYAVLSLIARAVGQVEVSDLAPLFGVLILSYALCGIQMFGVESLLIRFVGKLSPIRFIKGIAPAGIVAFSSQSSVGTIPVTARQLEKELGVDGNVASFAAGLGANLGMPGCAGVWPVLLAVFAIHVQGLEYSLVQYGFLVVLALVVALGTVGVPGAGTIAATALFSAAGLPIEFIILLTPISTLVDMIRTATNVVGAATAAVLAAEKEGLLDHEIYNKDREKF